MENIYILPPAGYDAVIGEPGGDLNYDECIGASRVARDGLFRERLMLIRVYNVSGRNMLSP
jgi:hypothetical protein